MKKLKVQYSIFLTIVIILFGTIIISQKMNPILEKKVNTKINEYIDKNYYNLKDIKKDKLTKKKNTYQKKITNKYNNYYYFVITYKKKKITDTYKKDYLEGYNLLKHTSKLINKDINKKINKNYKITINHKLNEFSSQTKNNIIKENNLSKLPIYNIEIKLDSKHTINDLYRNIIYLNNKLKSNMIIPESFNLLIKDNNKVLKIDNLKVNNDLKQIISDIISNSESDIINKNNITYELINEEV